MIKWVFGFALCMPLGALADANSLPPGFSGKWSQQCESIRNNLSKITELTVKIASPITLSVEDTYFASSNCNGAPLATNTAEAEVKKIYPYTLTDASTSQKVDGYALKLQKLGGTFQAHSNSLPTFVGGNLVRTDDQKSCELSRVYKISGGFSNIFIGNYMIGKPLNVEIVSLFAFEGGDSLQWAIDGSIIMGNQNDYSDSQEAWNSINKSWGKEPSNFDPNKFMHIAELKNETMAPVVLRRPGKYIHTFTSLPSILSGVFYR